jgi:membrane protein implicated in regulation of membrane protease activity
MAEAGLVAWTVPPWGWAAFGLVLIGLEILVPGLFLVWFGAGALATAVLAWVVPELGLTAEAGAFVVVSGACIAAVVLRQGLRQRPDPAGAAILNDRMAALVGAGTTLADPIVNGHGRAFFGDTLWQVTGPDRPAGTPVRVVGHRGMVLVVEPLD